MQEIKYHIAFEPGWRWLTGEVEGRFGIVNPEGQLVAFCGDAPEPWIQYCRDITPDEKCIALGVAKINCKIDIKL